MGGRMPPFIVLHSASGEHPDCSAPNAHIEPHKCFPWLIFLLRLTIFTERRQAGCPIRDMYLVTGGRPIQCVPPEAALLQHAFVASLP